MKKTTALMIALLLLYSCAASVIAAESGMPTADELDGYENVCLTYTFDYYNSYNEMGAHTVEDLLPYVGYYDRSGLLKDYFFDSFLFLPCVSFGPSGGSMVGSFADPSNLLDWTSYIDDTFKEGYNVDALNTAFGQVKDEMQDASDKKAGVFFTILYPIHTQTNFGSINGEHLDFSSNDDRKKAVKWMIDEQISRYTDGGYENLDMVGFYWFEEYLFNYEHTQKDIELLNYTADYLHSLGLKFIWIPWYQAYGSTDWKELGFDVACMQPNLFWADQPDYNRVRQSINYSKQYGLGMEMEVDPLAFHSKEHFNRYLLYLEDGMKYGAMDSIKMYYQDKKPAAFGTASKSEEFQMRVIYDLTYKYAKGTLTESDIDNARNGKYPEYSEQPEQPETGKIGDINSDGVIDTYDYVLCKRIYFETYYPTAEERILADVNRDGTIDVYDCILVRRHYFGTYVIR
ncbi:MAG: DUF4855 domain-containing protein [Clostridia bacterium]|nr:DUF4855 domain-containing protein [Clostridia bacterium]